MEVCGFGMSGHQESLLLRFLPGKQWGPVPLLGFPTVVLGQLLP